MSDPMIAVPRDPTPEMVEAGRKAFAQGDPIHVSHARVLWIWMDMLEAFELTNGSSAAATAQEPNNVAGLNGTHRASTDKREGSQWGSRKAEAEFQT